MGQSTILELQGLKENFGDDNEIIVSILDMFLQEVPTDYDNLKQAVENKNYEAAGLLAHKVKSSYRTLDMETETFLLQEIENKAKNNEDLEDVHQLFDQFNQNYQEGLNQVKLTLDHHASL
ncbi:hypothetical protein AAT17_02190 [Nonlabens sp. MIC269]|nr:MULTISPECIES: Hpt domain-containing protein [Nonlabens]ALM20144.1 hypothetical protein AAT17_02190 [Nonlabens sp. MIC269]MEE2802259.1 Hpt domain-containing protein [Bacteroidota bacterium]PQJ18467.1 hypothetical protein BST93_08250 [Nonlabens tegetincola]